MENAKPPPLWQRALGFGIGTAVGGIIYGIFLQALLVQSLLFDNKPMDPANWRTELSGRAWICGLLTFLTLVCVPFRFITREPGLSVLSDDSSGAVAWFLIAFILLIQLATVRYATMRPELCAVEHPSETFPLIRRFPIRLSFAISYWKNWIQLLIPLIEFLQLMSMALDGGVVLKNAGVTFISTEFLSSAKDLRDALWQFGMRLPAADPSSFNTNFGLLCGFCGFYILLCGVFIALDLGADSSLAPLLFTLLAGGFYGTITAGLLLLILYSTSVTHVIVGLLMLAYYSSTAVFVSIYRSDLNKSAPGEIRIIPTFTAIERVMKGILAAISVAANNGSTILRPASVLFFSMIFLVFLILTKPYSVYEVTALRIAGVAISAWTAFLVLIAHTLTSSAGPALTACLVLGWILIAIATFISQFYRPYKPILRRTLQIETQSPLHSIVHVQPSTPENSR